MTGKPPHTRRHRGLCLGRALGLGVLVAAAGLWIPGRLRAQTGPGAATTSTKPEPAEALPFSLPARWLPKALPIVQAGTVREALSFTEEERTVLSDVTDGDRQLNAPALYVLLRRAEMLPPGEQTLEQADQPNPENFWLNPQRYRGALVRVEALYARTTDWSKQVIRTRWWADRPVYWVDVIERSTGKPLIVMMTRKPEGKLALGQRLRLAGIFYKVVTRRVDPKAGDPSEEKEYPVIVASSIYRRPARAGGVPPKTIIMMLIVGALLLVFVILRRQIGRRPEPARGRYRPRRLEDAAQAPAERTQDRDRRVDEELARQVEAYRAERKERSEGEDADHADNSG